MSSAMWLEQKGNWSIVKAWMRDGTKLVPHARRVIVQSNSVNVTERELSSEIKEMKRIYGEYGEREGLMRRKGRRVEG